PSEIQATFTTSCAISVAYAIADSGDLQEHELAAGHFVVAEFAIGDVADLGEVARTARAFVVDLLALPEQLQTFDSAVDLGAVTLANAPHVIVDACARRAFRFCDCQRYEAR